MNIEKIYFIALLTAKPRGKTTAVANEHTEHSELVFKWLSPLKRNQDSLEKWLIPRSRQQKYHKPGIFCCPRKKMLKKMAGGPRASVKGLLLAKSEEI